MQPETDRFTDVECIPSRMAVRGHPIHPILVSLPITLLSSALFTDLAALSTRDRFWPRASRLLLGYGLATGALSAGAGLVDFVAIRRVRSHKAGWIHFLGNAVVLALAAVNYAGRDRQVGPGGRWGRPGRLGRFEGRAPCRPVTATGTALSAATFALLAVTGWFGGELVYRHRIAVTGHGE